MKNDEIGKIGEKKACTYLIEKGYKIIRKNFFARYGEIDIIATTKSEKTYVFIEVKTRTTDSYGTPEDAVTHSKLQKMKNAALLFMNKIEADIDNLIIRFDMISVLFSKTKNEFKIKHYKNIQID